MTQSHRFAVLGVIVAAATAAVWLFGRTPLVAHADQGREAPQESRSADADPTSPSGAVLAPATPGLTGERSRKAKARAAFERGVAAYFESDLDAAIAAWDRELELMPQRAPSHWQRGIALYQAGRPADAARQFEQHQTLGTNDVENAAWHLLCVACSPGESIESARAKLLPIDLAADARVPMAEIYRLYAGRGDEAAVRKAAAAHGSEAAAMFADLYLGMWAEVGGDHDRAKELLAAAGTHESVRQSYMARSAAIHLKTWDRRHGEGAKTD